MVVTVPEKTLEHWISQYIANRYAASAALWWPTRGEDINVGSLPIRPGKAIQLEVKTSTRVTAGRHDVRIDLEQLRIYRSHPLALQPFYVFPLPYWRETLQEDAQHMGYQVTEGAFKRSGWPQWFGHWMVVLTTEQVHTAVNPQRGDPKTKVLARVRVSARGMPHVEWPNAGGSTPPFVGWSDFWEILGRCGRWDWPQLVRIPRLLINDGQTYTHDEMLELLQVAATEFDGGSQQSLATFWSSDKERFIAAPDGEVVPDGFDFSDGVEEHRQIVFVDARNF
ncbi:MAG: hypothetical protein U5N21_15095 [Rhodococcus sp. (in: high G+C Gram-positive bacteria)]|nr:hypothetical protein [Rhodococcus sp. (in: high G+C Gram-positive bacteria)]